MITKERDEDRNPDQSAPTLALLIRERSFRTLNNSESVSCSNPTGSEGMSSLKHGLMLRTSGPLSPCKGRRLYCFDINWRHGLRKNNHITFIHSRGRLSSLLREYATENLVSVEEKKKKSFLLRLMLLWPQLGFGGKMGGTGL